VTTSSESAAGLLPATRRALTHRVAVGQAEGRTPSLAAAVVRDGGQAWFGSRSMLDGHEPDGDTQYRIGSLTKTFIAVLVMRLRDEGRLDLADPLGKHLDAGEAAGATIAQLLSHTAGLASETPGPWWERSPGEFRPGLGDILSPAPHPAGRLFHYSNPGYGLLGALVGQLRGHGWEEALREEILDPLGMSRTTLAPEEPHARGFAVHPWADVMQLEPADPAGLMAPAGELWSTAEDLCRFAVFLLDGDDRVLPAAALAEMRTPASPPGDEAWAGGYGLGLQLFRQDGRMLYGHSGSMPGFLATLCVCPGDGVGGITLANATSGPDIAGIAIDLVRIVADNEPRLPARWQPLAEVDQALLALTGPWYWGPRAYVLRLVADRGLELGPATGRGRASRFRAEPDGTWTGLDGYYTGETLRLVRGPDGTVDHLDLGSFVFTREPYGPDAPLAARPDPQGWRAFLGSFVPSDRVASGFSGVGPPGRGGPAAVPARRAVLPGGSEGEPGAVPGLMAARRPGSCPAVLRSGPGAAVADGVAVLIGHGHAPRGRGVPRSRGHEVAGQSRVDGPDAGDLAGPLVQAEQGGQRDGQGHPAGEPARRRARRASGRGRRAVLTGPGVLAQDQVQERAGAQLIHAALQPGPLQLTRPAGDPLIRGQHLVGRQLAAHQGGVAGVLGPPLHPRELRRGLPPLLRLLRRDFHHGAGGRGAQPAGGQPSGPAEDLGLHRPGGAQASGSQYSCGSSNGSSSWAHSRSSHASRSAAVIGSRSSQARSSPRPGLREPVPEACTTTRSGYQAV